MKIAILGAGVAGLCSAIALRLKGHQVLLYERTPVPQTQGAGMVLWPNATAILARLDLLSALQQVSARPRYMRRLSWQGEALGQIDIARIDAKMGYASVAVLRRDLQQVLLARLNALGIAIQYQHRVTGISADANGEASVAFDNGERLQADLIIAADGRMRSQGRLFVSGDNTPRYQGFVNWIGVVEWQQAHYGERAILDYWGIGQRFGIVPLSARKAYWAAGIAQPQVDASDSGIGADIAAMQHAFADWPDAVKQIVHSPAAQQANKIYVHDLDPSPLWHKNNVLMIGDAAHAPLPTSGQGACQAIEDAWYLAEMLSQSRHNALHDCLLAFARLRLKKTSTIIHAARGFANSLYHTDPDYCATRDQNSRTSDFAAMADGMANLWALADVA